MRIVGGALKGRTLAAPEGGGTRPTSDRVRESLFNILVHGVPGLEVEGAHVLDLFAGSGAMGIEALSRGARYCLLVEENAEARAAIRRNVEALGLTGQTKIFRRDATDMGPAGRNDGFSLAFLDPPYGRGLGELALASIGAGGWLVPGAVVVLEERVGAVKTLPIGYVEFDRRSWGDTEAVLARWTPGTA